MREKMPFFFSPPYHVPRMTATFFSMLKATAFSLLRPCFSQCSVTSEHALMMVKSGSKPLEAPIS